MQLRWTAVARKDLREIYRYIRDDNPAAARLLHERIKRHAALLQDNPRIGRPGRVDGTRELVVPDRPYIVVYRIQGHDVQILTVYHASRRWPEAF